MDSFMMMAQMSTYMACYYYPYINTLWQHHVFRPFGQMGYPNSISIKGSRYFSPTLDFEYYMPITSKLFTKIAAAFHRKRVVKCSYNELINFVFKRIANRSDFSLEFTSNNIWHIIEYAPQKNAIAFDGEYCDDFVDMADRVKVLTYPFASISLTKYNVVGKNPFLFLYYHLYRKHFRI